MRLARGLGEDDQLGQGLSPRTRMTQKIVVRKVHGGKLFRLRYDPEGRGQKVSLDGDFFVHPEEGIDALERYLERCVGMKQREDAVRFLEGKIDEDSIQIIGADAEELIAALWEAMG